MLSDTHIGEWGFSALVEVDGEKILFDTGSRPNTVFQRMQLNSILIYAILKMFT